MNVYLVLLGLGFVSSQTVVDTEYGPVRGHLVNVDNGLEQTTVEVFYGIPFAKPPVGSLRFASPEPPDPWTEILEADTIRDMCPQLQGLVSLTHPDWEGYGEDCLHLNIYTPVDGQGPYPVMFWIFGGAYQFGGNIQYPGHSLASRGVVVVTVNYRVNNFGFAFTGNNACPGNAGLWDQNAGLRFVVNNIANFGGDPNRITVFGQSAGGASTSIHMVSPHSKDLFQQAVAQSGAETTDWTVNPPSSHPEDHTRQMAQDLDCDLPDDYDMMDCLRQLPWRQLVYNSTTRCTPGYVCLGMAPVVDGPGGFLPQMPADLRASGSVMDGPFMSGIVKEDAALFLPLQVPGVVAPDCCNRTYFERALRNGFVDIYAPRLTNVTEEDFYRAMDYQYSPWPYIYDTDSNRDMLVKLCTDWSFGVYWDRHIKDHQDVAPTYGYVYDYQSSNATLPEWMGSIHAAEIDYLWGYPLLELETNEAALNDSLMTSSRRSYNPLDIDYTIFVQELWTNFAKYGNPTPFPVNNPLGGTTIWPQFTFDKMDVLYFGEENIDTITEYRQKYYAFWSEYVLWIAGDELAENGDDYPLPITSTYDMSGVWRSEYREMVGSEDADIFI